MSGLVVACRSQAEGDSELRNVRRLHLQGGRQLADSREARLLAVLRLDARDGNPVDAGGLRQGSLCPHTPPPVLCQPRTGIHNYAYYTTLRYSSAL